MKNISLGKNVVLSLPSQGPSTIVPLQSIEVGNLTPNALQYLMPTGTMIENASAQLPGGWLVCDGSALSRITYAKLFAAIGTNYGIGDGSTTFNIPDLRGMFTRMVDNGAGHDPDSVYRTAINGGASGDVIGSYQPDIFGSHTHGLSGQTIQGESGYAGANSIVLGADNRGSLVVLPSGGNETRPKNVYVNKFIKY